MTFSHGLHGYTNHHCRCETCRAGMRAYASKRRRERAAQRVMIDGRLVAPVANHGLSSTYDNWACRCIPCSEARRRDDAYSRRRKAKRSGVRTS